MKEIISEKQIIRFWKKVTKTESCWLWNAAKNRGYGVTVRGFGGKKQKTLKAHRLSYEMKNGIIPDGFHVLHKCDNPSCVNPDHLFLGNQETNMKDMTLKKRHWCLKRTKCFYGHELYQGKSQRYCLTCQKIKRQKQKEKNGTAK